MVVSGHRLWCVSVSGWHQVSGQRELNCFEGPWVLKHTLQHIKYGRQEAGLRLMLMLRSTVVAQPACVLI